LAIFVKYEYWYYHLKTIRERNIPLLMISSIFRKKQIFFKWYGEFYRRMLKFFTCIFVQDEQSVNFLIQIDIQNCSVSGDTRFDRVAAVANNSTEVPQINDFIENKNIVIAGSTWRYDEKVLAHAFDNYSAVKLIIVPHEVHSKHLLEMKQHFPSALFYSELLHGKLNNSILIIDKFGMLSRLYKYATITYIGGGFNKSGIHNSLEAAVYGKPIIFGPNYHKFKEARELISAGAAFSISNSTELRQIVNKLLNNKELLHQSGEAARMYVQQNMGATEKIMKYIQENRLLTN
ncbi:MAG: 3-deoxy-D-manno-octulosonic acid transferase, partial [Chitinophagaceae bacterium]|nr:3-deoxy-D-manno-octulosonic acid transferase [Chitinophagaceae bacterium]